jgi:hypothetical protein
MSLFGVISLSLVEKKHSHWSLKKKKKKKKRETALDFKDIVISVQLTFNDRYWFIVVDNMKQNPIIFI